MKYLAAYALLTLAGKKDIGNIPFNIAAKDIKSVLGSAQVNVNDDDLNRLVEGLKGKDINKLIAEGVAKIGTSGSATAKSAPQEKKK